MATVKRKHSRARGRTRRAGHPKLSPVTARTCPKCGETMMPHRICSSCGQYRGKEIIKGGAEG